VQKFAGRWIEHSAFARDSILQAIGEVRFHFPQGGEAARNRDREVYLDVGAVSFPKPSSNQARQFLDFLFLHLQLSR
jgi:hypothetical protein